MAVTTKQKTSFQKQLEEAQRQLDVYKASQNKPVPRVLGATATPPLNAAQLGGASGIGFEDTATQTEISGRVERASNAGAPKANAGNAISNTVNKERADFILKGAGLTGLIRPEKLVGLSTNEAQKLVREQKVKQQGQVTAGTSAVFNPEITNKTKRAVDNLGFALNDITNSPFDGKQTKLNKTSSLIESTSKQLARLFQTPEDFQQAYNTNLTFKDAIDRFQKAGGKADTITGAIAVPVTDQPTTQTSADYLASMSNPQANQVAEKQALDELIPEREIAQEEIARQSGMAQELKKLYFGDEQTVGLLAQEKAQAEEEVKINEREEKNEQNSLKSKAKFAIERNKAELRVETAKIEENRLAAKNYMTGYLAKLGALNTTGAAGLAIATLDTKYNIAKQGLETQVKYDNREIELNLVTDVNKVETDTDREILKIQQDLTKTTKQVFKEVNKVQQASDREVYQITASYGSKLRERTAKYTQDIKTNAEKYAKEFAKKASNGLNLSKLQESFTSGGSPASKSKIVSATEQQLEASRGADGYVNSEVYVKMYKEWIAKGGTATTFKAKYPPVNYANPDDTSLPPQLRYAKESQTLPKEDDEDETDFSV